MFSQQSSWNFTINNCSCYRILKVIQITKQVVLKKIKTCDFLYLCNFGQELRLRSGLWYGSGSELGVGVGLGLGWGSGF